jgi:hypothetical protein
MLNSLSLAQSGIRLAPFNFAPPEGAIASPDQRRNASGERER